MTDSSRRSPSPAPESLQLLMERSIDQLGGYARDGIEPSQFLREVLCSALHPGGASRAILWRLTPEGRWQIIGDLPGPNTLSADGIELRQKSLHDAAQARQPFLITEPDGVSNRLTPIVVSGQTLAVLETLQADEHGSHTPTTTQFLAALSEITADFLSQHELQQLRLARAQWQQWDHYAQRLGQSFDLQTVCAVIANDGLLLVDCDRISVLVRRGRGYHLKSISGVDRIEPRSTATRSIEALALLAAQQGHAVWKYANTGEAISSSDEPIQETVSQHLRDSGASALGLLPILARSSQAQQIPPPAVIVLERFHPVSDAAAWQARAESLANRSRPALLPAIERDNIPWLGLWNSIRAWPTRLLRPTSLLILGLLAGLAATLTLVQSDFTISGSGTLWPAQRREVFASTSGIIDQILVSHGDSVAENQPLIVLRDPELEAESPRIFGEIATVNERLKGVQSARLTGGNTPDAATRSRQLTVDEEELKERLRTLERQRVQLEERQAALTLRSPIAGQVLTWDVTQQLSSRPVERGQSLLSIGQTGGPWIIEVEVADKDIGHLLRAQQTLKPNLDVEFMLAAEPGQIFHGHIERRSVTAEPNEEARSCVHVVVAFDRNQIDQPRPGATALPRIECGPRSLGYVWLHDVIDAVRTRLLF